jgi:hypothetical protein
MQATRCPIEQIGRVFILLHTENACHCSRPWKLHIQNRSEIGPLIPNK